MPNLVAAATSADPSSFAQTAGSALHAQENIVIVGHSASGPILPVVAGSRPGVRLVFVAATLPPCEGTGTAGGQFLEALRGLATNGVLPVWSQWWGEGVLQLLVHDETRRREIELELPRVPLAFFEAPIALPTSWCARGGAFLLLSEFYRADATTAAALGWSVVERPGGHLDVVNDEEAIAGIIEELADYP
ncbi:MAG: hypothetical protein LC799_26525 [Actinobacteria bacterium]|nr:hypothetical protein [Actinomycetota bacterium]